MVVILTCGTFMRHPTLILSTCDKHHSMIAATVIGLPWVIVTQWVKIFDIHHLEGRKAVLHDLISCLDSCTHVRMTIMEPLLDKANSAL
jgi:hypothetical protein